MTHDPREIADLFTKESLNADGGVTMLRCADEDRKTLYLTNANGQNDIDFNAARYILRVWPFNLFDALIRSCFTGVGNQNVFAISNL